MWATQARADAGRHDRHHRVHRPAQQALRRPARGRLRQPDRAAGGGVRLPGPQRGRQDDDAADGPRPGPAQRRGGGPARGNPRPPPPPGPGGGAGRGARALPPPPPAAVARVGALVEGPGFYPYLSGRDNLRVLARYRGVDDSSVDAVLDRVDLGARGGDRYSRYSLGMKQRLGVAAALLGDPDLLVLDEPTNGLGPAGMADMRSLLVDVAAGGQTVVLSSHLLTEVQEVCDRVGVIADGRLLTEGTVAELRGATAVLLRAEPLDEALAIAMRVTGDDAAEGVGGEALHVHADPGGVPRLTRELVTAGVDVLEVTSVERSLEEVFLAMTGAPVTAGSTR